MPQLGELERAVMAVLWAAGEPLPAKAIGERLADRALAVTTVLTVLSRLERKAMVRRRRDDRAHTYEPVATRDQFVAELMREALGAAGDRGAALASFVGAASADDIDVLRKALRSRPRP